MQKWAFKNKIFRVQIKTRPKITLTRFTENTTTVVIDNSRFYNYYFPSHLTTFENQYKIICFKKQN